MDRNGNKICSQKGLEEVDVDHFDSRVQDLGMNNIGSQMQIITCFPSLFYSEQGKRVGDPVSLKEIEDIFKKFSKSKSPSPDGWTVEFFLGFFYLPGGDLLAAVESSWSSGLVTSSLYSTFISLIPKKEKACHFCKL